MQATQPNAPAATRTEHDILYQDSEGNNMVGFIPALNINAYEYNPDRTQQHMALPFAANVVTDTLGPLEDYMTMWKNRYGSAKYLREPSTAATPDQRRAPRLHTRPERLRGVERRDRDQLNAVQLHIGAQTLPHATPTPTPDRPEILPFDIIFVHSDRDLLDVCNSSSCVSKEWRFTDIPTISVPLVLLERQVQQTSEKLTNLIFKVEGVESTVSAGSSTTDLNDLIHKLHSFNTELIALERRWKFQEQLATSIQGLVDPYVEEGSPQMYELSDHDRNTIGSEHIRLILARELMIDPQFGRLENKLTLQSKMSRSLEHDIRVLPRRISNQFTAIYNLIAQRDTQATIRLAENSHQLAQAALRESSSMKTIAAMTLIFLPGTFICSFFSMTFFDWRGDPSESVTSSLWIYFAVALPLTVTVILIWVFCTARSRKSMGERALKRRATLLPMFEKRDKTT